MADYIHTHPYGTSSGCLSLNEVINTLHTQGFILDNITELLAPPKGVPHSQLYFEERQGEGSSCDAALAGAGGFDHELGTAASASGSVTSVLTGTIVSLVAQVGLPLAAGEPIIRNART